MIRIGLRFRQRDVVQLRALAARVEAGDLGAQHVQTFRAAADAATTGEPLIVVCEHSAEALLMADGYARFGVARPAVEELTGIRPPR